MPEELKPCPFCGSRHVSVHGVHHPDRPLYSWSAQVLCTQCMASATGHGFEETEEEAKRKAVEAWQRRPACGAPETAASPEDRIKAGDLVRHFKGGLYRVLKTDVFWHEDKERLVLYRSMKDGKEYVRPWDMFCSPTDREKYPEAAQPWRFMPLVEPRGRAARPPKELYYLGIADKVSERATCLRRRYGAVIVKDDRIVSTGYNGAPRGEEDCLSRGRCLREEREIPHGSHYELCRSVHAEQNAIIHAACHEMRGAALYIAGREAGTGRAIEDVAPCLLCRRMIVNAGIARVVVPDGHGAWKEINFKDDGI